MILRGALEVESQLPMRERGGLGLIRKKKPLGVKEIGILTAWRWYHDILVTYCINALSTLYLSFFVSCVSVAVSSTSFFPHSLLSVSPCTVHIWVTFSPSPPPLPLFACCPFSPNVVLKLKCWPFPFPFPRDVSGSDRLEPGAEWISPCKINSVRICNNLQEKGREFSVIGKEREHFCSPWCDEKNRHILCMGHLGSPWASQLVNLFLNSLLW